MVYKLLYLQNCKSKRTVSLKFSVKGVKVYDEDEMVRSSQGFWHFSLCMSCAWTLCYASHQTLLMAHAMCRVSLSTARQSDAQFAFVSHNPGHSDAQLYCHLFRARHARAVSVKMTEHPHCCYVFNIPGTTCLHILLAHPGLYYY